MKNSYSGSTFNAAIHYLYRARYIIPVIAIILSLTSCSPFVYKMTRTTTSWEISYDKPQMRVVSSGPGYDQYDDRYNEKYNTESAPGYNFTVVSEILLWDNFGNVLLNYEDMKGSDRHEHKYRQKERPDGPKRKVELGAPSGGPIKSTKPGENFIHFVSLGNIQTNEPVEKEPSTDKENKKPSHGLLLRTGLEYVQKGGKDKTLLGESKTRLNYIKIPVIPIVRYPLKSGTLYGGFGPYFAYGIGGNIKETVAGRTSSIKSFSADHFRRFDAGVSFIGGYEFNNGFRLHLTKEAGVANISKDEDYKMKNRSWSLNVGYSLSTLMSHVNGVKDRKKESTAKISSFN